MPEPTVADEQATLRYFFVKAKQTVKYHRMVRSGGLRSAGTPEPQMELNTAIWMLEKLEHRLGWVQK